MQISSRFTIAIHILSCIDLFGKQDKITSDYLAGSIGVNPVIIRNILLQLKEANLINVKRGSGGASLNKDLKDIKLLDIFRAVEANGKENILFSFHENPNPDCPLGKNIHNILDDKLIRIQNALENELNSISMEDVEKDAKRIAGL